MIKFKYTFLLGIFFLLNNRLNSMDVLATLFNIDQIEEEAIANIAKREAAKRESEIAAEKDRIIKERVELLAKTGLLGAIKEYIARESEIEKEARKYILRAQRSPKKTELYELIDKLKRSFLI